MKKKHTGLIGAVLAGLATLLIVGQLVWASAYRVRPEIVGAAYDQFSAERLMIDSAAVSRMDLVEPSLPKLVRPKAVNADGAVGPDTTIDFAMFGRRLPAPPVPKAAPPAAKPKPHPYRVAMTYVSGEHRYAVIDGKLYRKNARLPHGENLAEIAVGAVRLESTGGARWLEIDGAGG